LKSRQARADHRGHHSFKRQGKNRRQVRAQQ
jgi:hypothetical protein